MRKTTILLGGVAFILSLGFAGSAGAVSRLKQTIQPLECTAERVQNGPGSVSSLRPEECDDLLAPSEEAALRAQLCPSGTVVLADGSCYVQNGLLNNGGLSFGNASQPSGGGPDAEGEMPVDIQTTQDASIADAAKKVCSVCLNWWWVILLLIASNLLTGWLIWGLAARRRRKRQDD